MWVQERTAARDCWALAAQGVHGIRSSVGCARGVHSLDPALAARGVHSVAQGVHGIDRALAARGVHSVAQGVHGIDRALAAQGVHSIDPALGARGVHSIARALGVGRVGEWAPSAVLNATAVGRWALAHR